MSCSNRREKARDVRSGEAAYICLGDRGGSASPRIVQSLQTGFCACVRMRRTFELSSKRIEKSCRCGTQYLCLNEGGVRERTCRVYAGERCSSSTLLLDLGGENGRFHCSAEAVLKTGLSVQT